MQVTAKLNNLRISPRKVRLIANFIKGLDVEDALVQLNNTIKRSAPSVIKLLNSAIANAENNFGLDRSNLYVHDIRVGEGLKLKRWLPRAYGRATTILKRSSKVSLVLEERIEGKNRKTKEQMEKEKKQREDSKKKAEDEMRKQKEEEGKKEEATLPHQKKKSTEKEEKKGAKKGWIKKVFSRKSG